MSDQNGPADSEAFATTVPLTDVFGSHPKTLLVSALLTESPEPETHFSVNELARISGLSDESVREHVEDLQVVGIVRETDELDDQQTYKLEDRQDVVETIRTLESELYGMIDG